MKVFIVTVQPFPNGLAGTGRVICYAKSLLNAGLKCEVVVFHRTEVYGQKPKNTIGKGVFEGIPFRYIGGTPLRASNVFLRKINDWRDKVNLLKYLKDNMVKGDAILTYYRQNPMDYKLLSFANKNGFHIYRDLCEYPFATSRIDASTESRCKHYMENVFTKYDGAICISQPLYDLAKKYHPRGKHIKIPILIDKDKWNFDNVVAKHLAVPYIFHSGALFQQKDGIVDVLNCFADALPDLPVGTKYYFTGKVEKSVDSSLIQKVIEERHLQDNVEFLGFLEDEEMKQYIKGASLFIIYKNDNLQNRYCFATKLGEYLLSAKPVVTTNIGEAMYYLVDNKNAYVVDCGNHKMLSDAIVRIMRHKQDSLEIASAGKKVAEVNFCYEAQSKKLADYFCS